MKFSDLEKSALQLNELYEQLEIKRYGRIWTTEELALGFVGDVGDLAKLIQANAGIRDNDCKANLAMNCRIAYGRLLFLQTSAASIWSRSLSEASES